MKFKQSGFLRLVRKFLITMIIAIPISGCSPQKSSTVPQAARAKVADIAEAIYVKVNQNGLDAESMEGLLRKMVLENGADYFIFEGRCIFINLEKECWEKGSSRSDPVLAYLSFSDGNTLIINRDSGIHSVDKFERSSDRYWAVDTVK